MGIDKYNAINNKYRVSEKALFSLAILGGALGVYLGMYIFHHKTKKRAFQIGIPLLLLLYVYLLLR